MSDVYLENKSKNLVFRIDAEYSDRYNQRTELITASRQKEPAMQLLDSTPPPTTHGYRLLGIGDVLRSGDQYQDRFDNQWYPTQCVGLRVGVPNRTTMAYRRPVQKESVR